VIDGFQPIVFWLQPGESFPTTPYQSDKRGEQMQPILGKGEKVNRYYRAVPPDRLPRLVKCADESRL
jgi:hypothetical protein